MFPELDNLPKGNESITKNDKIDKPKFHNVPVKELKDEFKKRNLSTEGNTNDIQKIQRY